MTKDQATWLKAVGVSLAGLVVGLVLVELATAGHAGVVVGLIVGVLVVAANA